MRDGQGWAGMGRETVQTTASSPSASDSRIAGTVGRELESGTARL